MRSRKRIFTRILTVVVVALLSLSVLPVHANADRGRGEENRQQGRSEVKDDENRGRPEIRLEANELESAATVSTLRTRDGGHRYQLSGVRVRSIAECQHPRCRNANGVPVSVIVRDFQFDLKIVGRPDVTDIGTKYAIEGTGRVEGLLNWNPDSTTSRDASRWQGTATLVGTIQNPRDPGSIIITDILINGIAIDHVGAGLKIEIRQIAIDHVGAG
jgi:hypothetical protein